MKQKKLSDKCVEVFYKLMNHAAFRKIMQTSGMKLM